MNFSIDKIIKGAGCAAMFIGFFMMLGAVGSSDLAVEMGVYEPWYAHMGIMLAGLVIMVIGGVITSVYSDEFEDD